MADDLMIEVTGSAKSAESALDGVRAKLDALIETFDKLAPSVAAFNKKLDSMASTSKAFAAMKSITDATNKSTMSVKDAESRMAMYQARLDRATVSMNKSAVASARLAEAQRKLREATTQNAETNAFLNHYKDKGFTNEPSAVNRFSEPTATDVFTSTPPRGSSAMASDFVDKAAQTASIHFDTSQATSALDKVNAYIDSLTPSISKMSAEAQAKFETLAAELTRVSAQIDNQRALYTQLGSATKGIDEGSEKFLRLEKRMLSADGAIDRLVAKSDKLKAQMADITSATDKAAMGMSSFGNKSAMASSKATTGFGKTLQMMEKMFIRIIAFRIFSAVSQGITTGLQNIARADSKANAAMSQLSTSALYLQNSIAAALIPAIEALTPVIVQVIDAISWFFNQIAIFTAQITGQKTVTIAAKSYVDYAKSLDGAGDSANNANKKVKELQRTILGFDELNILQKQSDTLDKSGPSGPDYSSMFKTIPTPPSNLDFSNFQKNVQNAFDRLKDSADKAGKSLDNVKDKAKELEKELENVKLPALSAWKIPDAPQIPAFPPVPAPVIEGWKVPALPKIPDFPPVQAPVIPPVEVPAWDFGAYDKSKEKYQQPVPMPEFSPVTVPALDLNSAFLPSIENAKTALLGFSVFVVSTLSALGINVNSNVKTTMDNSNQTTSSGLESAKSTIKSFALAGSAAFVGYGSNVMENLRTTAAYIPLALASGLTFASKDVSDWVHNVSQNFATFGNNLVTNIGKTMSAWYSSFVGGLSAAWNQFTGFMSGVGESIGNWWNANKSWAAPAAVGLAVVGGTAAVFLSGGAALPAIAALAPVGLATGGLITGPTSAIIGEGRDDEAVLPLNPQVFANIGKGIRENGGMGSSSEMLSLLRSIDDSLKEGHNINLRLDVDGRPFVKKVISEMKQNDARYNAAKQY